MLHDTIKNKPGQTYSPVEDYRARMTIALIKKHLDQSLIAEDQTFKRWERGENTPSRKQIFNIINKIVTRPALGGQKLAAEIEDFYNIGPCCVPFWEALANEPYQTLPAENGIDINYISLSESIKSWYHCAEQLIRTFEEKQMANFDSNCCLMRISLRSKARKMSKFSYFPLVIDAKEVATLLTHQIPQIVLKYEDKDLGMTDYISTILIKLWPDTIEDDMESLAERAEKEEEEKLF